MTDSTKDFKLSTGFLFQVSVYNFDRQRYIQEHSTSTYCLQQAGPDAEQGSNRYSEGPGERNVSAV